MEFNFLLRGIIIGFSIAAPVGPIGILCIRCTLAQGRVAGLISGLGAATADAIYGSIAGFGLTLISNILVSQVFWLRLIGGIFLGYLGVKTFLAKPAEEVKALELSTVPSLSPRNLIDNYTSTLFLTLTNPTTILSFVTIFAGLGLVNVSRSYLSAMLLVLGVFIGSALWWLFLSGGISLLRNKLNASHLKWINRLAGVIIVAFGFVALLSLKG